MFSSIRSFFRNWSSRRRRLLAGVVGVAVETASACVPGVSLASQMIGQLAEKWAEDALDSENGQALPEEQLKQINAWLETLSRSYASLLDRLEQMSLPDTGSLEKLTQQVKQALQERADLAEAFDACLVEVRQQTLSLSLIERKLDEYFHVQLQMSASMEDIKALFVNSPFASEWAAFRKARPEAVKALVEADEYFLAGQRDRAIGVIVGLLKQRGVGEATLAHHLGILEMGQGKAAEASTRLREAAPAGHVPPQVLKSMTRLAALPGKGSGVPGWRSLPRGFLVGSKYRIETEIGRGGMASVYRAVYREGFEEGRAVAVKVPAPALMADRTTAKRFEREIEVSRQLSQTGHPNVVRVFDYEVLSDPFTGQKLYGMVMEYVEGESLAQLLARRRTTGRLLSLDEIQGVMEKVCLALEHAHGQHPPVFHRDLKPQNVMVGTGGAVKLMDFGIARILDDSRRDSLTREGQPPGSLTYMPPELLGGTDVNDARTDVYQAGNLLLELLTFDPAGDAEARIDCPRGWVDLIGDSMNRVRGKRPATIAGFLARLRQEAEPAVELVEKAPPRKKAKQEKKQLEVLETVPVPAPGMPVWLQVILWGIGAAFLSSAGCL